MPQFKKSLPFTAFFVFGALLYLVGYHPESENYSRIIFSSLLMLYTIWFITALSSSRGNHDWGVVVAAVAITFIITYTIPKSLVIPENGLRIIASILYGALTGTITYRLSR